MSMTDNCLNFNLSLWCVESLAASNLRQKTLNTVRAERFRVCWDYSSQGLQLPACRALCAGAERGGAAGSGWERQAEGAGALPPGR